MRHPNDEPNWTEEERVGNIPSIIIDPKQSGRTGRMMERNYSVQEWVIEQEPIGRQACARYGRTSPRPCADPHRNM